MRPSIILLFIVMSVFFSACQGSWLNRIDDEKMTKIVEEMIIAHAHHTLLLRNQAPADSITKAKLDAELQKDILTILAKHDVRFDAFYRQLEYVLEKPEILMPMLDSAFNHIDNYRN